MRLELTGFAPDADPATAGILTDCNNIIPSNEGLTASPSRIAAPMAALVTACSGAYVAKLLDNTKRLIAGTPEFTAATEPVTSGGEGVSSGGATVTSGPTGPTAGGLFEAFAAAWVDRSRAGGYTGVSRWRFTMFGSVTLATNGSQPIQAASSGANFADIAGAPKAAIVFSCAGFVMALNFDNGTVTKDGWHCSGIYDHTVWTPAIATQCANGRLLEGVGEITAGKPLGSDAVAYKTTSMYLGRYVGGSLIWSWQRIPGNVGTACNEAVVVIQTRHFFIGLDDFYVFDGTIPRSIGAPVREWFFNDLNRKYQANIIAAADETRDLIYWYYPSQNSASGAIDSCIIYNYRTDRWGKMLSSIEAAVDYVTGQITYDGLGALYLNYEDLPTTIAYDSPFWQADTTVPAVFGTTHKLFSLSGEPAPSYMVTGDFGDDTGYTYLSRVTPRYRHLPTTATATNYYKDTLGELPTQDATNASARNRFDFRRDARLHRIRFDFTGEVAVNGLDVDIRTGSKE